MNNFAAVFDPDNQLLVSEAAVTAAQTEYELNSRQLFYHLLHISEHYPVLPVLRNYVEQAFAGVAVPAIITSIAPETLQVLPTQAIHLDAALVDLDHAKAALVHWAPVILTAPSCLQNMAPAAMSDDAMAVDLFAIYLQLTQLRNGEAADACYPALLLSYGLELPSLSSWAFAQQAAVDQAFFDLAALQLALSQLPRLYLPEILGFTLAYCQTIEQAGKLAQWQLKTKHVGIGKYLIAQQSIVAVQVPRLQQIISRYLQTYTQQQSALWRRIELGHHLYSQYFQRCLQILQQQLQSPASKQQILIKVLERVAPKAVGHHGRIQLQGKNLDVWFSQQPFAAEKFLTALRASAYVDQQHPEQSRLLKLFDFSGPMFGVLNGQERKVLKDWLLHPQDQSEPLGQDKSEDIVECVFTPLTAIAPIDFARLSNRQLFYYLVNADLYPEVYVPARQRAQKLLFKTRCLTRLPFKSYQHDRLEQWINKSYRQEMAAYQPFQAPAKVPRNAYVWGIEQLAPTVLCDGCWLQGASQLQFYSTRQVGARLFSIYSDEIGAGKQQQNHPFIYRQLLQSLDIALPPTHSRDFIEHAGFVDSAFDIPVYLLTIGRFPGHFFAETLGVNLAIELSGLGRSYMNLADELAYWSINPAIVKVHISIDNAATGHTALATEAIGLYLDDILANQGAKVRDQHWRRIYTGYCSLRWVSVRFKYAVLFKYLQKRYGFK